MVAIDYIGVQEVFNAFNGAGNKNHLRYVNWRNEDAVRTAEQIHRKELRAAIRRYQRFNTATRRYFQQNRNNQHLMDEINAECQRLGIRFTLHDRR